MIDSVQLVVWAAGAVAILALIQNVTSFVRERNENARASRDLEHRISRRAYFLWQESGRPDGRSDEFWAEAVKQEKVEEKPGFATSIRKILESAKTIDTKQISDWFALLLKMAAAFGALPLVLYAFKEHFYYDLSSLAAVGLLVLVAFAFSVLVGLAAVYGFVSMIWVMTVLFRTLAWIFCLFGHPPKARLRSAIAKPYIQLFSFIVFIQMGLLLAASTHHPTRQQIWLWPILAGCLIFCLIGTEIQPEDSVDTRNRFLFTLAMPVLSIFIIPGTLSFVLDRSMSMLSFRSEPDQYITLAEPSYRKLSPLASAAGIQVSACELGKDLWLLRGVTVVWHGIGATSYVRIFNKSDLSLLVPLPSGEVETIFSGSPEILSCGNVPTPSLSRNGPG
jgi:hypothetical protein